MIVGLSIQTFTTLHVVISLLAIATSFVVMFGMLGSNKLPAWTAVCLFFTVLTTVTGFMFPFNGFTPAIGTGVVSARVVGVCFGRTLRQEARRVVALDLRGDRGRRVLVQRFRFDRPVI